MSQNGIDFPGSDPSGANLLDVLLNNFQEDVYSSNSGTSRPSYVVAGMLWIDTTTNPWVLKIFNGTDDIVLGNASTTGLTFSPSALDIVNDLTPQMGGSLDCNGHQIQWSQGADVASATALAVLTDGNYFDVTGTTTITSINTTGGIGTLIKLHFDGILTLTHDGDYINLPGGANITTAAGDEAEFIEYATGKYRCTNYQRSSEKSAYTTKAQTFTKPQIAGQTSLTSTSNSIAVDLGTTNDFTHTFTENTTLANPTNISVGQTGSIAFTQHASSPKTLAFDTYWKFPGGSVPTVTSTNSAEDTLFYRVRSSTKIECSLVKGWA